MHEVEIIWDFGECEIECEVSAYLWLQVIYVLQISPWAMRTERHWWWWSKMEPSPQNRPWPWWVKVKTISLSFSLSLLWPQWILNQSEDKTLSLSLFFSPKKKNFGIHITLLKWDMCKGNVYFTLRSNFLTGEEFRSKLKSSSHKLGFISFFDAGNVFK